jgi:hypothetical protein
MQDLAGHPAMIFPSATIVKVIAVQIVGLAMMGTRREFR